MKPARFKNKITSFNASLFLHLFVGAVFLYFLASKKEMVTPFETFSSSPEKVKRANSQQSGVQKNAEKPLKNDQRLGSEANTPPGVEEISYANHLRDIISNHQNYPILAQKRGLQGVVVVRVVVGEQGDLISTEHVLKPFSAPIPPVLIDSALRSVKSSSPFPPPPPGISRIFEIPIQYKISN